VFGKDLLLALLASFNPSMIAVVLYLATRPRASVLLVTYLVATLGASMALGILVVEGLASAIGKHEIKVHVGPVVDLSVGVLLLGVAAVALLTHWPHLKHTRKHSRLAVSSIQGAAVLGFAHAMPAAYYLVILNDLVAERPGIALLVVELLIFNVLIYSWTVVAVLTYFLRREWAQARLRALDGWLSHHGRQLVGGAAAVAGVLLVILGIVGR
jgi:Sap, sulfolipid-1-addressing protein